MVNANSSTIAAGIAKTVFIKDVEFIFRWCPQGTFMMGSPITEIERRQDEILHEVNMDGFWILETPITQRMFMITKKNNPSAFCATGQRNMHVHDLNTDDFPIEQVSWNAAEMYCKRITQMCRGLHYSFGLPTEAQWEYACRAGTNTPFYCGSVLTDRANFDTRIPYLQEPKTRNCPRRPTSVRTYSPNAWGIYDMHGNVYEWCSDWYGEYSSKAITNPTGPTKGVYKIFRGGSWLMGASCSRSARRGHTVPEEKNLDLGFRIVLKECG